jgi:hypothetical protein
MIRGCGPAGCGARRRGGEPGHVLVPGYGTETVSIVRLCGAPGPAGSRPAYLARRIELS